MWLQTDSRDHACYFRFSGFIALNWSKLQVTRWRTYLQTNSIGLLPLRNGGSSKSLHMHSQPRALALSHRLQVLHCQVIWSLFWIVIWGRNCGFRQAETEKWGLAACRDSEGSLAVQERHPECRAIRKGNQGVHFILYQGAGEAWGRCPCPWGAWENRHVRSSHAWNGKFKTIICKHFLVLRVPADVVMQSASSIGVSDARLQRMQELLVDDLTKN